MGKRKANNARLRKEAKAERAFAYLRNCPIATRKVRLVADMVRGVEVNRALSLLRYAPQASAPSVEKLLMSAVANWGQKHPSERVEDVSLYVKTIMVDQGRTLKRLRPRAQGRGARILKRSSHIMVEVAVRPPEDMEAKRGSRRRGTAATEAAAAVVENNDVK